MKDISEILEEFTLGEDEMEKVDILQRNDSKTFRDVLTVAFNKDIQLVDIDWDTVEWRRFDLPPGPGTSNLQKEMQSIYLFIQGHPRAAPNLTNERRKQILVQILEAMNPKESDVFLGMLKKDFGVDGLNADIIRKAFPGIPI